MANIDSKLTSSQGCAACPDCDRAQSTVWWGRCTRLTANPGFLTVQGPLVGMNGLDCRGDIEALIWSIHWQFGVCPV